MTTAWALGHQAARRAGAILSLAAMILTAVSAPDATAGTALGAAVPDVAADVTAPCEHVMPAGDLDGDGDGDAYGLSVRVAEFYESCYPNVTMLVGRRGSDGTALWSRIVAPSAAVSPARLGAGGADGLLVTTFEYGASLPSQPARHVTFMVEALAGDGSLLWSQQLAGAFGIAAGAEANVPNATSQVLDAVEGPADDVLVTTRTRAVHNGAPTTLTSVFVIDGATGTMKPLATELESGTASRVMPTPDLSGDGLDDVALVTFVGGAQRVVARRGSDGQQLWRSDGLPAVSDTEIHGVGDLNGDAVPEMLLAARRPVMAQPDQPVTLLDGRTGAALWTASARDAFPAGDANGDGRGEIGVLLSGGGPMGGSWLRFELRDASGDVVRVYPVGANLNPAAQGGATVSPWAEPAGDVDGDGVVDVAGEQWEHDGTRGLTRSYVHGVDGAVRWQRVPAWDESYYRLTPLAGTLDGAGDDLIALRASTDNRFIVMEGLDGDDGDVLWLRQLPVRTVRAPRIVGIGDLDGDDRVDIVVAGRADPGARHVPMVAVSGADGAVLWAR